MIELLVTFCEWYLNATDETSEIRAVAILVLIYTDFVGKVCVVPSLTISIAHL
jgi:hypothetical protein